MAAPFCYLLCFIWCRFKCLCYCCIVFKSDSSKIKYEIRERNSNRQENLVYFLYLWHTTVWATSGWLGVVEVLSHRSQILTWHAPPIVWLTPSMISAFWGLFIMLLYYRQGNGWPIHKHAYNVSPSPWL